ncbi:UNVERIFIED_CONTAM: hypothetical protein PYX00_011566 [Menopon gallinae]|uniref:L-type lectin-like domain-containing protein n=1 Tax=Menopon gallinae TaxID=328185 RepID=A0AAW2H803_9NEOP
MALLLAFAAADATDYREIRVADVGYNSIEGIRHLSMSNAIGTEHGIVLKSSSEKGSLVTFDNKNPSDDWSFSFTITTPSFSPSQFAGVYLWYTDHKVAEGSFRGAQRDFRGMMAGIEFSGKSVELVLAANDGRADIEDPVIFRDSVNHRSLLYDNLRFREANGLGSRLSGKYFGITSYYQGVPHDKKFVLKGAVLHERHEHDSYDPLLTKSQPVRTEPRMFDEVMHSNKDTRHLISSIEHYMEYIKTIVGDPAGLPILEATSEIRHDVESQTRTLRELVKHVATSMEDDNAEAIEDLSLRVEEASMKLSGMHTGLKNIDELLVALDRSNTATFRTLLVSIIALAGLATFLLALEKYSRSKI